MVDTQQSTEEWARRRQLAASCEALRPHHAGHDLRFIMGLLHQECRHPMPRRGSKSRFTKGRCSISPDTWPPDVATPRVLQHPSDAMEC